MAADELGALVALSQHRGDDAVRLIERAVAAEDATTPFGPSGFLPAHELYGEILLALSRPREAAQQFDLALKRTPNRAASLLGRARSAMLMRDGRTAVRYYSLLADQWHGADADVPELTEVLREAGSGRE
jgi:hypothetical protein